MPSGLFDEGYYTAPKADTMPGGAPLTKARARSRKLAPCKYGPRDEQGRCPKKPAAPKKARSTKPKPPCKYGPRDENGRCPKKPASSKQAKGPQVKELKSVDGAARQAGEVIRSKTATSSQKKAAVRVLGQAVAAESGKKVAEHVVREAKKAVRQSGGAKAVVKKVAGSAGAATLARAGLYGAAFAGVLYTGAVALNAQRAREAKKWADEQLSITRKRLPQLTVGQAQTLWNQYFEHAMKRPVTNSFVGK